MAGSSRFAVTAAIGGNTVVMIAKFTAFGITGSGAMLSEGIHTLADVMNQILLLFGIVRSQKKADSQYQFGYAQERFVWALVSAVGIFFLGCGVTIYHGISTLMHPHEVTGLNWAIGVLLGSLVIEGIVLVVAYKGLREAAGTAPFFRYLRSEADPSAVAVLLEDGAACAGIVIALVCITLTSITGDLYWDAVGSISIGVLLGFVAVFLVARNRELLLGQAAPQPIQAQVRSLVLKKSIIEEVVTMKSKVLDTESYDITLEVEFDGARIAKQFEEELKDAWENRITDWDSFYEFALQYTDDVIERLGDEIDKLESEIIEANPMVKHIDIEPD